MNNNFDLQVWSYKHELADPAGMTLKERRKNVVAAGWGIGCNRSGDWLIEDGYATERDAEEGLARVMSGERSLDDEAIWVYYNWNAGSCPCYECNGK